MKWVDKEVKVGEGKAKLKISAEYISLHFVLLLESVGRGKKHIDFIYHVQLQNIFAGEKLAEFVCILESWFNDKTYGLIMNCF